MANIDDVVNATNPVAALDEQHRSLARFEGTFRSEVKIWMQPGEEPAHSTGTMVNEMVLGGRFLQNTYEDDSGHFAGRGFFGYNTVEGVFEGFWIDTMATFFQLERGYFSGADNSYTMEGPMPPGSGTKRSVLHWIDKDHHSMTMFMTGPDGQERKVMEIRYSRA